MIVTINGQALEAQPGQTILQLALEHRISLAHFCYHEDLTVEANCRTCLVEVVTPGDSRLPIGEIVPACTLTAAAGLAVDSQTDQAISLRRDNLDLLLSHYQPHCHDCPRGGSCAVTEAIDQDSLDLTRFASSATDYPQVRLGKAIEYDPNLCIACNLCVKACEAVGVGYLRLAGQGVTNRLTVTDNPAVECVYCGQCTLHCPVAAIREQSDLSAVEAALANPELTVVVQMAPAVRVSIGELFGFPVGKNLERQMYAAFRRLGFAKIFDVNWGADLTTMIEAEELLERLEHGAGLPMFTSCCPAWVRFVEEAHPDFIPNLTTSRSPQIQAGAAYKTWWAETAGLDPQRIVVVSIMPCTAKKHEANQPKLAIDGLKPVDYVLTTREIASLLRKHRIDLARLTPADPDRLGEYSGAAVLFGASGGVVEAAMRTAAFHLTGDAAVTIDWQVLPEQPTIRQATVVLGSRRLRIAVVSTLQSAKQVLTAIRENARTYDYVEFMACPGGCVGGGGQPVPTSRRIIRQRQAGLRSIDTHKTNRLAQHNPAALEFLDYCAKMPAERRRQLLETSYAMTGSLD